MRRLAKWVVTWLPKADTLILSVAAVAWLHIWQLAGGPCGIAGPWYCDLTWYSSPNRILLSAICLRFRRTWLELVAALISIHLVVGSLICLLSPDELTSLVRDVQGGEVRLAGAIVEAPHFQGLLAAIIAPYALIRGLRRWTGGSLPRKFTWPAVTVLLVMVIGYASNFVSHGAAERETAKWIAGEAIKGRSIYGAYSDDDWMDESAERFRSVGVQVLSIAAGRYYDSKPRAEVGPSYFPAPFLISVGYGFCPPSPGPALDGHCLVVSFFGCAIVVRRDSQLLWKLVPYLQPW